jgi:hypothetical protein
MRRILPILATALASAGCLMLAPRPDVPPGRFVERVVVISVEGTPGLPFEGSYGTPSGTTTARGTVPAQYTVKTAVAVVAVFTKGSQDGELVVRILVDGKETQSRSTTGPYGSVVIQQRF